MQPAYTPSNPSPTYLLELLVPETPLWYGYALALYIVVLTSLRRVPPAGRAVGAFPRSPQARRPALRSHRVGLLARWDFGPVIDGVLHVVRGLIFIVLGASVVVDLIRWRPMARFGQFPGRRTLQIYVLHAPLMMIVMVTFNEARLKKMESILALRSLRSRGRW